MRAISHFNSAQAIVAAYDGTVPFAAYLKNYFRQHKKHGSSDRKVITQLCYGYFRIGSALPEAFKEQAMLAGWFISSGQEGSLLQHYRPAWNQWLAENTTSSLTERLRFIETVIPEFDLHKIFPLAGEISALVDRNAFVQSHLVQPDLFVRIRPGKEKTVEEAFEKFPYPATRIDDHCFAFPSGTKLESSVTPDKDLVIQDLSSQRVADYFPDLPGQCRIWDCCAGSGGKSILAWDHYFSLELTVSDVRPSILANLRQRFAHAGIKKFRAFTTDLAKTNSSAAHYDLVLADLPCSGSGTWGRSPEQLMLFTQDKLESYISRQRSILRNILPAIKSGGFLLYSTCSVYRGENEDQVDWLLKEFPSLSLVKSGIISGYELKADSMFAALLQMK